MKKLTVYGETEEEILIKITDYRNPTITTSKRRGKRKGSEPKKQKQADISILDKPAEVTHVIIEKAEKRKK